MRFYGLRRCWVENEEDYDFLSICYKNRVIVIVLDFYLDLVFLVKSFYIIDFLLEISLKEKGSRIFE